MTPVDHWWDVHGEGPPLVLLHPGGADSRAYDGNLPGLAGAFRTYRFDRRGQGRTPDAGGPITFADMTDDEEVSPHGAGHWPSVWARLDAEHHRAPALTPMHEALPDAQLAIVPGTGHGLLADKPDLCNRLVAEFLAEEPDAR